MNIIILGPPGSGKTTQAELLAKDLGVPLLGVGDLLHFASQAKTPAAREIKEKMAKGELVNDALNVQLIEEHLRQKEHVRGSVIDGFPRSLAQAKMATFPVDRVFYIKVSDETTRKRLLARGKAMGRIDDTPAVIEKRIAVFHEETEPVLNFYKEKGLLTQVDGEGDVEAVSREIKKKL